MIHESPNFGVEEESQMLNLVEITSLRNGGGKRAWIARFGSETTAFQRWLGFLNHRELQRREEGERERGEREWVRVTQIRWDISTHAWCVPLDLDRTVMVGLDRSPFTFIKVGSEFNLCCLWLDLPSALPKSVASLTRFASRLFFLPIFFFYKNRIKLYFSIFFFVFQKKYILLYSYRALHLSSKNWYLNFMFIINYHKKYIKKNVHIM